MSGGRVGWRSTAATAVLAITLVAITLVATAPAAAGHTRLLGTEPADRSVVTGVGEVALEFDGELLDLGAAMRVTGPAGEVSTGRPSVDGTRMTQPLRAPLGAGSYQVLWRATATDGHAVSGSWQFTVSASGQSAAPSQPGLPQTPAPGTPDPSPGWLLDAMIAVGVLALLGICSAVLVTRRRRGT